MPGSIVATIPPGSTSMFRLPRDPESCTRRQRPCPREWPEYLPQPRHVFGHRKRDGGTGEHLVIGHFVVLKINRVHHCPYDGRPRACIFTRTAAARGPRTATCFATR